MVNQKETKEYYEVYFDANYSDVLKELNIPGIKKQDLNLNEKSFITILFEKKNIDFSDRDLVLQLNPNNTQGTEENTIHISKSIILAINEIKETR